MSSLAVPQIFQHFNRHEALRDQLPVPPYYGNRIAMRVHNPEEAQLRNGSLYSPCFR